MASSSSHPLENSALSVLLRAFIFYTDPGRLCVLTSLLHPFKKFLPKFPSIQGAITLLLQISFSLELFPLLITYFNSASPAFSFHPVRHFSHPSFPTLPPFVKWQSLSCHLWQAVLSVIDIMAPSQPEMQSSSCSCSHAAEAGVRKGSHFAAFLCLTLILLFLIFDLYLLEHPRLILLLSALITITALSYLLPHTCSAVQTLTNISSGKLAIFSTCLFWSVKSLVNPELPLKALPRPTHTKKKKHPQIYNLLA